MKSIKKLLPTAIATVALSSFSIAASAWEPTFYAGANLGSFQHKQDTYDHNFTILSAEGLGGINLLPYLSVEGRIGVGYNEDRQSATSADLRETYYASFYLRPNYSNEKASLYGLIGATSADISSNQAFLEDSDTGMSVGVGVSFVMSPKVDVTAEWKRQVATDNMHITGGTVGFIYKF